jgi:hypothetical protein
LPIFAGTLPPIVLRAKSNDEVRAAMGGEFRTHKVSDVTMKREQFWLLPLKQPYSTRRLEEISSFVALSSIVLRVHPGFI